MALEFDIKTSRPCKGERVVADFVHVAHSIARRRIITKQLQVPSSQWLHTYSDEVLLAKTRELLKQKKISLTDVGMMAWSRLNDHDGEIVREGIIVHVVDYGEPRVPVVPRAHPRSDAIGDMVTLEPTDPAMGQFIHAAVYDVPFGEAEKHPVTAVMLLPEHKGAIALRGTETMIPAKRWLNP